MAKLERGIPAAAHIWRYCPASARYPTVFLQEPIGSVMFVTPTVAGLRFSWQKARMSKDDLNVSFLVFCASKLVNPARLKWVAPPDENI
jgi:hypothetical protein